MYKIAIYGYGNLGKGAESAILQAPDMELLGIFSRRPAGQIQSLSGAAIYPADSIEEFRERLDAVIICGGSATDLPCMTPMLAEHFNVIDSFDTHAKIGEHFGNVDRAARTGGKTAVICGGWDPGLFSLARVYGLSFLPRGKAYTFWGKGVSQGHSDAIRRIPGVLDARQYTIPVEAAVKQVEDGKMPDLTAREKHTRECFVVAEPGADLARIEQAIVTMPNYFADYDTTVHFISEEELLRNHSGLPHGGQVIRSGKTGLQGENTQIIKLALTLDSNPQFTGSILTALARAAIRLNEKGVIGCKTILDIPPALLSDEDPEVLRETLL